MSLAPHKPPGPPNSSDEHVSCNAPATENASFQIFFKCPTLAIVFGNATKPSRFAHFWQGPQSLAPATRNSSLRILFKSPTPANAFWNCYETVTFWLRLAGCIVPCACHTLPHKTTLQRPKWPWCALYMLTSKRASRHNGVHFFDTQLPKVLEPGLFCAFWLRNVLRATTACTCSTAQLPKVVWD